MKKNVKFLAKTTLSLSILMLATSGHAAMTLEEQVVHLQQQVQELQSLMQQQKQTSEKISAELPILKEKSALKTDLKQLVTKGGAELSYTKICVQMRAINLKGQAPCITILVLFPWKAL